MADKLTYPSLRCVLEYLEANKRIHITSRSSLRLSEKSIPLHLEELNIQNHFIKLNDISWTFKYDYADFFFENTHEKTSWNVLEALVDSEDFKIRRGRISEGTNLHSSAERALSVLLGGRQEIYVQKMNLEIFGERIFEIFSSSKLKIRELKPPFGEFAFSALRVIDPSSFPLKSLRLVYPSLEVLSHEMVKTAENLIINCSGRISLDSYKNCFQNLSNKNLFVRQFYPGGQLEIVKLVENWIEKPRNIGTSCRIGAHLDRRLCSFMKAIETRFKANYAELKEPGLSGKFLVVPINSESELHISALTTTFLGVRKHILMEVMPAESSVPCASDASGPRPQTTSVQRIRHNPDEIDYFELLLAVIWLMHYLLVSWRSELFSMSFEDEV